MKGTIFSLLVLLLLATPAAVQAQSGSGDDFDYSINASNANTITITNYTGPGGAVNIPTNINGLTVTSIGYGAFYYGLSVTNVNIPNSVTSIGGSAFSLCFRLTSVTLGNSVTTIGAVAFGSCTNLTSINIPNSVASIGESAFEECSDLTNVNIPSGVTNIGDDVFSGCAKLTSVNIPNSVTNIGDSAFVSCSGLTNVTIGNSVTHIGAGGFAFCTSLTSVHIPNSVTNMGANIFLGCGSLTAITVDAGNPAYSSTNGVLFDKKKTILIQYPGSLGDSYTIPNSVTSIGDSAFESCCVLTSVNIPNSVTNIGESAFDNCTGLTSINISDSITRIADYAFQSCTGLTSFTIPDSVTNIGEQAFASCSSLTNINIPNSVTSIGDWEFNGCSSLASINIPNSVTSIGLGAFGGSGLTSINIGTGVTNINYFAFQSCTSLTNVNIPNSVTRIYGYAFESCSSLTSIKIPNSVTSIGTAAFYNCTSLSSITIPNSVTMIVGAEVIPGPPGIAGGAFQGCTNLTNVTFGNGITSIGNSSFESCSGLTSVMIPDSVASIGESAFEYCTNLTNVTIGSGITNIGVYAFEYCSSLTAITVDPNNPDFSSVNGVLFDKSQSTLIEVPRGWVGGYVIPGGVTSIADFAFTYCDNLTSITFPGSVTYISPEMSIAFCVSLTNVYFQGNAPNAQPSVFFADNTTAYYLPGTTGWSNFSATTGLPVVMMTSSNTVGALQVAIAPAAAAITAGAQWQVDGGKLQNNGAMVFGLSGGKHTVSFSTISGWTTPTNQTVSIKAMSVATAKGTYTFSAEGIYNGLFMDPDAGANAAGMLKGLTISSKGTYSGTIIMNGASHSISGSFDSTGQASYVISHSPEGPLTVAMTLNLGGAPQMTGTVSGATWTANLTAELAATSLAAAKYTMVIPADPSNANTPTGSGYAVIANNAAGAATISGVLADGVTFSQSVNVSQTGDAPIYASLYGGQGVMAGWINLEGNTPAAGSGLTWVHPRHTGPFNTPFTNSITPALSPWSNATTNGLTNLTSLVVGTNTADTITTTDTGKIMVGTTEIGSINSIGQFTLTNGIGASKVIGHGVILLNDGPSGGGYYLKGSNAGAIQLGQ